tara:strand:- start:1911 stop:2084 length:174 start_codon:yes stop_codon:yes gene_type:complete
MWLGALEFNDGTIDFIRLCINDGEIDEHSSLMYSKQAILKLILVGIIGVKFSPFFII